jgi:hypothetical protein
VLVKITKGIFVLIGNPFFYFGKDLVEAGWRGYWGLKWWDFVQIFNTFVRQKRAGVKKQIRQK